MQRTSRNKRNVEAEDSSKKSTEIFYAVEWIAQESGEETSYGDIAAKRCCSELVEIGEVHNFLWKKNEKYEGRVLYSGTQEECNDFVTEKLEELANINNSDDGDQSNDSSSDSSVLDTPVKRTPPNSQVNAKKPRIQLIREACRKNFHSQLLQLGLGGQDQNRPSAVKINVNTQEENSSANQKRTPSPNNRSLHTTNRKRTPSPSNRSSRATNRKRTPSPSNRSSRTTNRKRTPSPNEQSLRVNEKRTPSPNERSSHDANRERSRSPNEQSLHDEEDRDSVIRFDNDGTSLHEFDCQNCELLQNKITELEAEREEFKAVNRSLDAECQKNKNPMPVEARLYLEALLKKDAAVVKTLGADHILHKDYPEVTLTASVYIHIRKTSETATVFARRLMRQFFKPEILKISSLTADGKYDNILDPSKVQAIKACTSLEFPSAKKADITGCMTDCCVQARKPLSTKTGKGKSTKKQN